MERNDPRSDRIGAEPQAVSRIHQAPGNRERGGGQVQLAGGQGHPASPGGFSLLGGHTLSKSTDNGSGIRTLNGDTLFPQDSFCLECEWAPSIFDVRHRFVSSVLYELPFGAGKPYLTDGFGGALLGGWQISAIISLSSGFPRNVTVGTDRSNTGGGQDRPNATGESVELPSSERTVERWFNTSAFLSKKPARGGMSAGTR